MSTTTITRTAMTDDDGTGTTGTIFNNAWKTELYNQIDALISSSITFGGALVAVSNASAEMRVTDGTKTLTLQPQFVGTSSAHDLKLLAGNATKVTVFTTGGVNIGSPTGGDKGAGTLNCAAAYYANGTAGVATFGPAAVVSITVKNGLVTAIS